MSKPPRQPPPRTRKTDVAPDRVAGPVVTTPVDPRQAGLFDAPLPGWIKPCLPTLVDTPPVGPKWVHEIKWDGYRVSAYVADGKATIRSATRRFPVRSAAIARGPAGPRLQGGLHQGEMAIQKPAIPII